MAKKDETPSNWSPRSQASLLREAEARQRLQGVQAAIVSVQRQIAEEEVSYERVVRWVANGQMEYTLGLQRHREQLDGLRNRLAGCEDAVKLLEAEISAEQPTPQKAAERLRAQEELANLAVQRLALDEGIDGLISQLRRKLADRQELTETMRDRREAVELNFDLDEERFADLQEALPKALAAQSRRWAELFLSREETPIRAVVRDEQLVLPETLAHNGVYSQGEVVELTEAQFAELSRLDRSAPTPEPPWHYQPPSVISIDDYEAIRAEAEQKGISVKEAFFWQDMKREEENKQRYLAEKEKRERQPVTI